MVSTIVWDGPFRLFFFSREETRIHVHVGHPDGEAKFWLTPAAALATETGLSMRQLREAQDVVQTHLKEIQDAWNQHFPSSIRDLAAFPLTSRKTVQPIRIEGRVLATE